MPQPPPRPEFHARRVAFGRRLRRLREQQGLTQEQLAERAHLDVKTISRLENGRFVPDLDRIYALADGLGTPPALLLVEEET